MRRGRAGRRGRVGKKNGIARMFNEIVPGRKLQIPPRFAERGELLEYHA